MRVTLAAIGMACALGVSAPPALAQSLSPSTIEIPTRRALVSAGVDVMATSAYVWRGFVPTDAPSVQPAPWIKIGAVTITSWANVASHGSIGTPITEHDATIDYTRQTGAFALSAGYTNYFFPHASSDRISHEFYAGVAHDSYFSPSLRIYRDVAAGHGTYANASVAHTYALASRRITLTPNAAIGFNHHQWTNRSTWSDLSLGVRSTLPPVSSRLSLSPFITYSRSLAADMLPSRLYGGLVISAK